MNNNKSTTPFDDLIMTSGPMYPEVDLSNVHIIREVDFSNLRPKFEDFYICRDKTNNTHPIKYSESPENIDDITNQRMKAYKRRIGHFKAQTNGGGKYYDLPTRQYNGNYIPSAECTLCTRTTNDWRRFSRSNCHKMICLECCKIIRNMHFDSVSDYESEDEEAREDFPHFYKNIIVGPSDFPDILCRTKETIDIKSAIQENLLGDK